MAYLRYSGVIVDYLLLGILWNRPGIRQSGLLYQVKQEGLLSARVSGGVVLVARLLLDRSPLKLISISDYFPEYFSDYFPDYFCLSQVLDQNLQFPTSRAIRHLADLVWSNDQKQRRKLRKGHRRQNYKRETSRN